MPTDFGIKYTINLAEKLKEENLFINAEKNLLHTTYESLETKAKELRKISWITYQQKRNLKCLLRNDKTALKCIKYSNILDGVRFVEGYQALTYNESRVTDFIRILHDSPDMIAYCLDSLESRSHALLARFVRVTHDSLFAYSANRRNETLVLRCLLRLVDLQISTAADTRRRLRRGTGALVSLFRAYADTSFTSRLFLTQALRAPLLEIVRADEWFYDVDEKRALHRFSAEHYKRRFGVAGSSAHDAAVAAYRRTVVDKLVAFTRAFVDSLRDAMPAFPVGMRRLVAALYRRLVEDDRDEARAACADLVFTMYVFPAICDPGPHSILPDVPISYTANHNLMQVAQIIQNLAVGVDSKDDLYSQFEPDYISFMMDSILSPLNNPDIDDDLPNDIYYNHIVQLTIDEICDLIGGIRDLQPFVKNIDQIADRVSHLVRITREPNDLVDLIRPSNQSNKVTSGIGASLLDCTPPVTPPPSNKNKSSVHGNVKPKNASITPEVQQVDDVILINIERAKNCPGLIPEFKFRETLSHQSNASTTSSSEEAVCSRSKSNSLVIPGSSDADLMCDDDDLQQQSPHSGGGGSKRTRFSMSTDQTSNTCSENMSTLSDVAASGSVMESDGDDFEQVEAGRRTPSNVSDVVSTMTTGDTPSHGDERRITPNLPITVRKKNLEDVTDRFGKFEIKQDLERFEIKSTVSDTWSTDVLASDSETADQNQLERLDEVNESSVHPPVVEVSSVLNDRTDTASEAWSTDVLGASDTSELQVDRLMELDQDDIRTSEDNSILLDNLPGSSRSAGSMSIQLGISSSQTRHSSYADSHDSEDDNKSDNSLSQDGRSPSKDTDYDAFGTLKAAPMSSADKDRKENSKKYVNLDDIKLFDPLQSSDKTSDSVVSRGLRPKVSFRPISDLNPTHQPIKEDLNRLSNEETVMQVSSQISSESMDKHKKHHSSFFKSFKDRLTYKGTKRKTRYDKDMGEGDARSVDSMMSDTPNIDASDAIFEKYRTTAKPIESVEARRLSNLSLPDEDLIYDASDLENCKAFKNAKSKLRIVFSTLFTPYHLSQGNEEKLALRTILKLMLAEVTLLEDQDAITKLHETLRCLQLFNHNEFRDTIMIGRILHSMNSDLVYRQSYNEYILKSRRELYIHKSRLQATLARVKKDRDSFNDYFLVVYVKIFLMKWDKDLSNFQSAFKNLTVSDEKITMMDNFLSFLNKEMLVDSEWKEFSSDRIEASKVYMERFIMGTIYHQAMFPNQDADRDRDIILEKHISHLQTVISPRHKNLRIKREYLFECPWPAAQEHISMLSVFRTPTDKLGCILRCTNTILNLLTLADPDHPPAADDIMPILIYVIIQANPPSLLSTLQYVSDFSRKLTSDFAGEASYCWTQFSSAVEYIKTID